MSDPRKKIAKLTSAKVGSGLQVPNEVSCFYLLYLLEQTRKYALNIRVIFMMALNETSNYFNILLKKRFWFGGGKYF